MRAIERVKSHFSQNKGSHVDVPEWGSKGQPFKIFYDPMTPYQRKRLAVENGSFDAEMFVEILIMKAQDENGEKLFSDADRHALLTEADGAIIGRIALAITAPTDRKVIEKN